MGEGTVRRSERLTPPKTEEATGAIDGGGPRTPWPRSVTRSTASSAATVATLMRKLPVGRPTETTEER
jgi:hypothetical protein